VTDFSKRQLGGQFSGLQADIERAVGSVRRDVAADRIAFSDTAGSFASPGPTTIGEALERIAAAVFLAHGAIP
jgi:hypothetical protein